MAIDKILGNGNLDQVADSVFSAVNDSVSEIKAMQKRKAAENVQIVIQALKKIESDLQDKYDGVTTVIEKRVASIKNGQDGRNGVNGKDGKDGRPGRDGATGPRGADGLNGSNGVDGEDGVSVTNAKIDFDGSLVIALSSGREINVGEVVAPELAERIKVITNGGGTSQGVLDTLTSLQNQINVLTGLGAVNYVGTWNASTNTPTLVAGTGDKGDYYVVSVAGGTSIDGQALWGVGDWIIFNGVAWQKVDGGSTGDFTTISASGAVTLSGGTANGVTYLNGSKVLTSGSALTFDGTNFVVNNGYLRANNTIGYYTTLTATGLTNFATSMDFDSVSDYIFKRNAAEQMRLTSIGLGIGTSSPAASDWNASAKVLQVNQNDTNGGLFKASSSNTNFIFSAGNNLAYIATTTNTPIKFYTNTVDRMTLDSSGNLGLGVTPSAWNTAGRAIEVSRVGNAIYSTGANTRYDTSNAFLNSGGNWIYAATGNATLYTQFNGTHSWSYVSSGTAGAAISFVQAMTLDASGNLLVGTTSSADVAGTTNTGFMIKNTQMQLTASGTVAYLTTATAGTQTYISFYSQSTATGSITTNGTVTNYATTSDYRLKNTVAPMTGALAKVALLKPVTYKWNADGSDGEGFIAHELAEVCPDAVTGEKDAVDADGKPQYQGIDVSFLVGTLTAAIQELKAIVDAQGAEIAALKAAA